MSIDTQLLLRLPDRAALDARLRGTGSEASSTLFTALAGGGVRLFTGLAWVAEASDAEARRHWCISVRLWLEDLLGPGLAGLHDDPRGVFAYPDVCAPDADAYDGVIDALAGVGFFIDAAPVTAQERQAHDRKAERRMAAWLQAAFGAEAQQAVAEDDGDFAAARGLAVPAPDALQPDEEEAAMRAFMAQALSGLDAAVGASARVAVLLPAALAGVLEGAGFGNFDVQACTVLADGSVVVTTARAMRAAAETLVAEDLGTALHRDGIDAAGFHALPFFAEAAVVELAGACSFEEALRLLGERAVLLPLRG